MMSLSAYGITLPKIATQLCVLTELVAAGAIRQS